MLFKTILVIIFGLATGVTLIAERNNNKYLSFFAKSLATLSLMMIYYYTAKQVNYLVIIALMITIIADFFLLKKNKLYIFFSLLLLFNIFIIFPILQTNYYLVYVPLWFYICLIPLIFIVYSMLNKIWFKLNLLQKIPLVLYYASIIILTFVICCRAWKYRGLPLYLPIIGGSFLFVSSLMFILHKYFDKKEVKNINLYYTLMCIYGQMFLIMGIIPDW